MDSLLIVGYVPGVTSAGSGTLIAIGLVLLSSGLALLGKAGVTIPVAFLVAVPLSLAAVSALVLRTRTPSPVT